MGWSPRVEEAFAFAAEAHREQVRKGSGVPYLTHLMAVAALVGDHRGTEDQVVAALLHDVMEDLVVAGAELAARFGEPVAAIVAACTDTTARPKPPWRPRKEAWLAALRGEGTAVRLVVAADKLHNVQSIRRDLARVGPAAWDVFTVPRGETLWYYREALAALSSSWSHPILDELSEAILAIGG